MLELCNWIVAGVAREQNVQANDKNCDSKNDQNHKRNCWTKCEQHEGYAHAAEYEHKP